MGLLTWGNTLSAQMTEGNKKILVAYFSCTGTTKKVAEAITETTGEGVFIGPKCNLITINHDVNPDNRSATYGRPIVIEDKVWIGINSTILPGVKIGYGSIVGAQSVVTHDVPPMTIVAGNPARIIKKIEINHE